MNQESESSVRRPGPRIQQFQAPQGDLAILAGSGNPVFAQAIATELGVQLTPCESQVFSEGNVFVRILENVRGRDTFIIQGVHHPVNDNFVELLFWIDALKRASAQQVTAVIPYFSYAKGDKKDEPRVSIRARVCADAIEAAGADRVLCMDLHSPQIQGFFSVPVDHLYARAVICEHMQKLGLDDLVVCSPDAGFAKAAAAFANLLSVPVVIGNKSRPDHSEQAEFLLSTAVHDLVQAGALRLCALHTDAEWFGLTFPADTAHAVARVARSVENAQYPEHLSHGLG